MVIFVHLPCQFLMKVCYLLINEENRSDDGFTWSTPPFINLGLLIFVFRLSDTFPHETNFVPVLIGLLLLEWVRNLGQQRTAAGMQALKEVTIYSQMKGSPQQTFHGLQLVNDRAEKVETKDCTTGLKMNFQGTISS